ncbi:MAG: sigma-54-dependent Fis family transcriptional regulator [Planctomycetes bacterium]|nr:sigma-54-dependent Fis family transcriptional regulator [Planctomycetota bacterium]
MLRAVLAEQVDGVLEASCVAEGLAAAARAAPQLILLDMRMPDGSGLEFLRAAGDRGLSSPIVVITAFAEVEDAVEAMKLGAVDYLTKPIDLNVLETLLDRFVRRRAATAEPDHPPLPAGIVFVSPLMRQVLAEVTAAARSPAPVLLTGESGTGKEVLAELLHRWGDRPKGPLVSVNTTALPATLIESEFFGHERGAFTGADRRRAGHFERASGGTLFLDEIGDLPRELQPKLLRALETGRIRRLGGEAEISVDVRLVSATNRDLEAEIAAGRFRTDLYYRLAVFGIEIPPLRERPEDILPLAHSLLAAAGGNARHFAPAAEKCLTAYAWPGNVRELRNSVQRAAILAPGDRVLPEHLPPAVRNAGHEGPASAPGSPPPRVLAEIEREAILAALARCGGNRTHAARALGISRRKLLYRLREYGVEA